MKNSLILLAIFVLLWGGLTHIVLAQSNRVNIEGVVADSLEAPLAGASVVLLDAADSSLVSFGTSRSDGLFRLRRVKPGAYRLQITFLGFEPYNQPLQVGAEDMNLGAIPLQAAVSELDALVITAEYIPMVVKKDTLEYNAEAFQMRPNASVEDLLRRLPGIEVEQDGSIKAQGEDVQQVLVDGKEFFGNDPRIATQNLPADAVEKVQVYDKKSDMAEFTGIDDGEEAKTINLALNEDSKQGYFGNATGGFGNDGITGRYEGKASINRFSPTTQMSFIGNFNNVNQQGFSMGDYMGFMGGVQVGRVAVMEVPMNSNVNDGFSVTTAAGLNFNHDFNARTSLQSSYFLNIVDNDQDRLINQQQLIGSTQSSFASQTSLQRMMTRNHRLNLNLKHEISKGQDLRLRANLSATDTGLDNESFREISNAESNLVNDNQALYGSDGLQLSGNAALTYRKKLSSRGRTLVAEARSRLSDGSSKVDLETLNNFYDTIGNVMSFEELSQFQSQLSTTYTHRQRLSWTEPITKKSFLQLHGELRQMTEEQDKSIFDLFNGMDVLNNSLSSALDQSYRYRTGGFNLRYNPGAASFVLGLDVQSSELEGFIQGQAEELNRSFVNVLPSAMFTYDFTDGIRLDLRYRASTREPTMNELQPFADNSDPLNVYIGNPNLKPEYNHTASAHFMLFDQFSFTNLFGFFQVRYATDKIARDRSIDDQFRQVISTRNVDSDWQVNGTLNFGTPIRSLGTKVNLSSRTMYNRGLEFINSEENQTRILRQTIDLSLENREKDVIDASLGARYTFNVNKYSLNPELGQNYINRTFYSEVTYYMGDNWRFTTGLDYRLYADEVSGNGQNIPLWRAEISRFVMKQKGEIQLVGLDLLDRNLGVNYTNSSNFIQEERINSLGRYVMLKFVYNLSGVGQRGGGIQVFRN